MCARDISSQVTRKIDGTGRIAREISTEGSRGDAGKGKVGGQFRTGNGTDIDFTGVDRTVRNLCPEDLPRDA